MDARRSFVSDGAIGSSSAPRLALISRIQTLVFDSIQSERARPLISAEIGIPE
jgi:hypothetical protein